MEEKKTEIVKKLEKLNLICKFEEDDFGAYYVIYSEERAGSIFFNYCVSHYKKYKVIVFEIKKEVLLANSSVRRLKRPGFDWEAMLTIDTNDIMKKARDIMNALGIT